jgi:hypothetical protein
MKAAIRACDVEELDVVVTIAVRMGGWINSEARAAARAGPAGTVRS